MAGGEGAAEGGTVMLYHRHNGHEFEQTLGNCEGQGSLVCCSPWGHKESDTETDASNEENIGQWQLLQRK